MSTTDNFANGLKNFFSAGSLYKRTRLTPRAKSILLLLIDETLSNTIDIEDEFVFDRLMKTMTFLKNKLTTQENLIKIKLTKEIAASLYYWIIDNKHNEFSNENSWKIASQWVCNLWCRQYSVASFVDQSKTQK